MPECFQNCPCDIWYDMFPVLFRDGNPGPVLVDNMFQIVRSIENVYSHSALMVFIWRGTQDKTTAVTEKEKVSVLSVISADKESCVKRLLQYARDCGT